MRKTVLFFLTFIALVVPRLRAEHFTVYFANHLNLNPEDVRVHAWKSGYDVTAWDNNPSMTYTGEAMKIGEKYYELFKHEFDIPDPDDTCGIIFRYAGAPMKGSQTKDLALVNGTVYLVEENQDLAEAVPLTVANVYFYDNAGVNMSATKVTASPNLCRAQLLTEAKFYTPSEDESYVTYSYTIRYVADGTAPMIEFANPSASTPLLALTEGALYHFGDDVVASGDYVLQDTGKFTFYFYNNSISDHQQWESSCSPMVYAADGTKYPGTINIEMMDRSIKGNTDVLYHLLYKCTLEWDCVPSTINFYSSSLRPYVNGYVYASDNHQEQGRDMENAQFGELYRYTLYFADLLDWGVDKVRLHAWSEGNGDYRAWPQGPEIVDTHKYVRVKDYYAPCYQASMIMAYPLTNVQWRRDENGDGKFVIQSYSFTPVSDGDLFWYSVKNITPEAAPHDLVDEIPVEPATIYFHTGANEVLRTNLWNQAYACFYEKGQAAPADEELVALAKAGVGAMTRVEEGMWKIEVDNIHKYSDVGFYYLNVAGDAVGDMVFRASGAGDCYDRTAWARYVYDIGMDCVYQSYITSAQFEDLRANPGTELQIVGTSPLGFPNDDMDLRYTEPMDYDNGIYTRLVTAGSQESPALFKLSFVDVKKYVALAGEEDNYYNQRGWATFNMDLIGAETRGDNLAWIKVGKPIGNAPGESNAVFTPLNNSLPYNKFNQFGWCISAREDIYPDRDQIEEGVTYWLIVDTHEADRSVSLISFAPSPTVKISEPQIVSVPLTYEKAAQLQSGYDLYGSHNGLTYFDRVNVATGTVVVTGEIDNDYLTDNHYKVRYTVMANDVPFYAFDGIPEAIGKEVPFLPVGENINLTVRARYTNLDTDISFCSRTGAGEYVNTPELTPPTIYEPEVRAFVGEAGDDCPEGWFAFGVDATYGYEVETELAHVADYELEVTPAQPDAPFAYAAEGWEGFKGEGTYDHDTHNWAAHVASRHKLPLTHRNIGYVDYETLESDFTLNLTAYAVYPFLLRDLAMTAAEPYEVPRRKAGDLTPDQIPDNLTGYTLIAGRASAPHVKSLSNLALTAIRDVSVDDTSSEAGEYYTLQGVRVTAPLAPGIYIRRQGDKVAKVLIK